MLSGICIRPQDICILDNIAVGDGTFVPITLNLIL